ncbi:MAG: SDR family oxidoreductase [Alphaproteobacteria bacterium]|nr:SDR family oxidoreductase [Alphaproteobacteria bacterium]
MFDLTGKRAVVTAAAQGIGRATAEVFLEAGAEVIACDINETTLASLSGATCITLDVTDQTSVEKFIGETGGIDILFNGAGYVHDGTILECSEDEWDFSFSLNVKSMYRMIKGFLPGMLTRGGGSIINVSSIASSIEGVPRRMVYGASKAAVIGLTKSVAHDYVAQGIRCNAICPGRVDSPSLHERVRAQGGNFEEKFTKFLANQPIGRLATPREIAALALYLASDEAAFTTGQPHLVDGGWHNG